MVVKAHSKEACPYSDEFAVLSSEFSHMKQEVQETKQLIKDGFKEINTQIKEINGKIDAQDLRFEQKYVTKEEFSLIQKIVYGGIAAALLAGLTFAMKVVFGW